MPLLEELRVWGAHEQLDGRIVQYLSADTIPELIYTILKRYEEDYETERPQLVRDAFTLLWAARRGLSESELMDLLGQDGPLLYRVRHLVAALSCGGILAGESLGPADVCT